MSSQFKYSWSYAYQHDQHGAPEVWDLRYCWNWLMAQVCEVPLNNYSSRCHWFCPAWNIGHHEMYSGTPGEGGARYKRPRGRAANMGSKISLLIYQWPLIQCKIRYRCMNGSIFKFSLKFEPSWFKFKNPGTKVYSHRNTRNDSVSKHLLVRI